MSWIEIFSCLCVHIIPTAICSTAKAKAKSSRTKQSPINYFWYAHLIQLIRFSIGISKKKKFVSYGIDFLVHDFYWTQRIMSVLQFSYFTRFDQLNWLYITMQFLLFPPLISASLSSSSSSTSFICLDWDHSAWSREKSLIAHLHAWETSCLHFSCDISQMYVFCCCCCCCQRQQ